MARLLLQDTVHNTYQPNSRELRLPFFVKQYPLTGIISLVSAQFRYIAIFADSSGPTSTGGFLKFHISYIDTRQSIK